jgi:hypothetical protein
LATSGTRHCTRLPKVDKVWLFLGREREIAAYMATRSSHSNRKIRSDRDEDMGLRKSQCRGKGGEAGGAVGTGIA